MAFLVGANEYLLKFACIRSWVCMQQRCGICFAREVRDADALCFFCAWCACGHRERLVEGVGPTLGRRSALACYAVYLRREYFRFLNRRAYELTRDVISRRASLRLLHVRVRHADMFVHMLCVRKRDAQASRARASRRYLAT